MQRLFATDSSWGSLVARLTLAAVIFPHGAQKVLGWFGGHGFAGTLDAFHSYFGVPPALTTLVMAGEFLGALGLAAGLLSRVAASGLIAVMAGTIAMVHAKHGFFMNWSGTQGGEGFEYALLVIGASLALVITGAGRYSLDGWIARRLAAPRDARRVPASGAPLAA